MSPEPDESSSTMNTSTTAITDYESLPVPLTTRSPLPRSTSSRSSSIASRSRHASLSSSDSRRSRNKERPPPAKRRRKYVGHDESLDGYEKAAEGHSQPTNSIISIAAEAHNSNASIQPLIDAPSRTGAKETIHIPEDTGTGSIPPDFDPLSSYLCPICFSAPTNATLTPCGHICCGECLFTAVRTTLQRAVSNMSPEPPTPRCPVCRAILKGWDGKGGGVIGLKARTIFSL